MWLPQLSALCCKGHDAKKRIRTIPDADNQGGFGRRGPGMAACSACLLRGASALPPDPAEAVEASLPAVSTGEVPRDCEMGLPGTPYEILHVASREEYAGDMARIARVVAPGIPHRITQRGIRRHSRRVDSGRAKELCRHERAGSLKMCVVSPVFKLF